MLCVSAVAANQQIFRSTIGSGSLSIASAVFKNFSFLTLQRTSDTAVAQEKIRYPKFVIIQCAANLSCLLYP
jgi:hypothetical protein